MLRDLTIQITAYKSTKIEYLHLN